MDSTGLAALDSGSFRSPRPYYWVESSGFLGWLSAIHAYKWPWRLAGDLTAPPAPQPKTQEPRGSPYDISQTQLASIVYRRIVYLCDLCHKHSWEGRRDPRASERGRAERHDGHRQCAHLWQPVGRDGRGHDRSGW